MVQSNQTARANQFVIAQFVPQSRLGQALDQLTTLVSTISDSRSSYPYNPSHFFISLAQLNTQHGRKAQAIKLLEQVTQELKQSNSPTVRSRTLIQLASQYQLIGNSSRAIQMLDAAVNETHVAYKEQVSPSYRGLPSIIPPAEVRNSQLEQIAKLYRSLNQ